MASCALGELIPCAFVWRDPGITPCCKSPKLPGDKILAIRRTNRRPPIYAASVTLPSSPARSSSGNEVPHIFTRKSRLQPGEFLVTSAKRLLQQYLPLAAVAPQSLHAGKLSLRWLTCKRCFAVGLRLALFAWLQQETTMNTRTASLLLAICAAGAWAPAHSQNADTSVV